MKKTILIVSTFVALSSCVSTIPPLYSWSNYETTSYNYIKNKDDKSTQELLKTYAKMVKTQRGTRGVPPPGICADYGYLLIQNGKTLEGKAMLEKEIALYPESALFISTILKSIEK
jgi:hypothetical protein